MSTPLNEWWPFAPIDKSWAIRMLMLAMQENDSEFGLSLLDLGPVPDDVQLALTAVGQIDLEQLPESDWWLDLGKSATLYRMLAYGRFVLSLPCLFTYHAQLSARIKFRVFPDTKLPTTYSELLAFENDTTQWASAGIIFGVVTETDVLEHHAAEGTPVPEKVALSIRCVKDWREARQKHMYPALWKDRTILAQMSHHVALIEGTPSDWKPRHSEDYCAGVAWGMLDAVEGAKLHPSVRHHESNREMAMSEGVRLVESLGKADLHKLPYDDHRVITSLALAYDLDESFFEHPEAVSKAWPLFWAFFHQFRTNTKG